MVAIIACNNRTISPYMCLEEVQTRREVVGERTFNRGITS